MEDSLWETSLMRKQPVELQILNLFGEGALFVSGEKS